MKKILLIIVLIFLIFQMVVLAVDIDIGNAAINRINSLGALNTRVDRINPANISGEITSIEIYTEEEMTGVKVATFFVVSGNNLSTRNSVTIGDVVVGYNQFDVSLNAVVGDYIGIYYATGRIDLDVTTSVGWWSAGGDKIPCTNYLFGTAADRTMSLYGTGATVGWPHKWNTLTIGKWNTKEFVKWNDLE